ncbi:asparagine synthase (glutamine-hydrolyzing) [Aestuariispira insulae]|uniref:asparagine synthase (glutamine-hydrolyzing) n=1 Tax=Aestuariispira insulae TaxID=1461337 RepID=A0A3D9HRY0_9PROT|nr:asparagine synthase (glutamine-hydrolyzing) [Aestuariispira insulae]RED52252.1 asparagine synthase (glutamine-hydrolysing) [Aestuariispira insulae]
MCGIAGIMMRNGSSPDVAILDRLADALAHRGPDGMGKHIAATVGLVQTRLAIIDLKTGDQPLYDPSGLALVGNGEIYNYLELREELKDHPFQTQSDCETPLYLYREEGFDFAQRLRGMYSLALHDPAEGLLILSRDPFGIKPLYYTETADYLAFASEAQALVAAGLAGTEILERRRQELLQMQFTCGEKTIYDGIQRVMPGETLVIRGGRIIDRRHLPALPSGSPEKLSEADAIDRLDRAIRDSVAIHQRSDVPYGLFLSGGIDSSALLSVMSDLNDRPIIAYTAGFSGTNVHDERDHARALAAKVGADHHEVDFGEADFWESLPQITAHMDDPAADYAILPTWKLAREAAQELKVVLSGEGGDELFAGYGRYRSVLRPWWLGGRDIRHRGTFDGLDVLRASDHAWRDSISSQQALSSSQGRSRLQAAQAIDCKDWLTNDLLTKLDRCLMAHGLEGRTPFLDREVANAAFRLPDDLKINKRLGKWVLRKWLEKVMPEAQPFTKKRGFTVPVGEWIRSRSEKLGPLVANRDCIQEIADPDRVVALFNANGKREGFAAWTLLFYALWHRANIERRTPGHGTVFEVLEEK